MGKTAKIILGVIGFFVLACIVAAVLGGRFLTGKFTEVVQESQRQSEAARTWARAHTQGDCMDEGMRRVLACPPAGAGFQCQLGVQSFGAVCLLSAAPTPGLCDGVPSPQEFTASSQWINARCSPLDGLESAPSDRSLRCRNFVPVLQHHCARRMVRAPVATAPDAAPAAAPDATP